MKSIPVYVLRTVAQLGIRRPSSWKVLLALLTADGRDTIYELSLATGLAERTVKAALADLKQRRLAERADHRYSPISLRQLYQKAELERLYNYYRFTRPQRAILARLIDRGSKLTGTDIKQYPLSTDALKDLGLTEPCTLGEAYELLQQNSTYRQRYAPLSRIQRVLKSNL
jgi:hypothetical protein